MYNTFAYVYDEFMENVPYEDWAFMLRDILRDHNIDDGLLLDLGCGTGTLTRLMADYGYDMTGIDSSADMLTVAREYEQLDAEETEEPVKIEKSEKPDKPEDSEKPEEPEKTEESEKPEEPEKTGSLSGSEILYLCQDMREFELYGTVRAVYSLCDCINYITEYEDLVKVFKLVNNYLDPNGIFIFDLNTIHKFSDVLGEKTFAENGEDASFIWENHYDGDTNINEYDLTLFLQDDDGRYTKETELHRQRGYTVDEIKKALEESGLIFESVCDEDTLNMVTPETERILFVARESGKTA